ncbi:MAG: hypothetical protein M3O84_04450 [Actinomycetota bacterium]|nr:hypothetical protein [Actinomycetota bacterium]
MELSRRQFLTYAGLGVVGVAATGTAVKIVSDQLATPGSGPDGSGPVLANAGCLWGAYVDPGKDSALSAIHGFETLIGRRLDLTRHYIRWDRNLVNDPIIQSAKEGRIPLIAWHTQRLDGSWVKWADIAAGKHDGELQAQAELLRNWGGEAYFVFNHEPENDPAGTPQDFVAAFDHVRRVFEDTGARRLQWVATLMRGTYQGTRGGPAAWVPRSCDLLGADGYNRGACNPSIAWESFHSIFSAARAVARSEGKGLVIEEWGCVEADACGGSAHGQSKAHWLREAGITIQSWPEVRAVIYSQVNAAYAGVDVDFRVNTSPSALATFRQMGLEPTFDAQAT